MKKNYYSQFWNCTLMMLAMTCTQCSATAQVPKNPIRINQAGYLPDAPKIAVITAMSPDDSFRVLDKNQQVVYRGRMTAEKKSAWSSLKTRVADFSALTAPGTYTISVGDRINSYPFQVGANVYNDVAAAVIKGFYYQRSDMPLTEKYAGKWARPGGHPDTVVLVHGSAAGPGRPAGTVISSPGGWYDAGDYNKYIVNSGITMGTLLSAFEDFQDYYESLDLNIPETGNSVPDILDEAIYNLRWMLTMQDPADGGVYHKCTNAAFDGMVMPGVGKAPRYVVQKGTAAALDFAAVTAQAARILKNYKTQLPGLADSCRKASIRAWQWSIGNPSVVYDQDKFSKEYKPEVSTGAYGDRNFNDEWFWAASELYVTTHESKYYDVVSEQMNSRFTLPSWAGVAGLGVYTLLRFPDKKNMEDLQKLKSSVIVFADSLLAGQDRSAFQTVMGQTVRDFIWGSSAMAANQGIVLINAYRLTENRRYLDAALSNLDYLLGRNATGYSFVTGIGTKSPMFPHHRPSEADGIVDPVPGLLAGGPNPGMQDKCTYTETEPETAYSDVTCSYASNEIAINWNAPIVYLANAIQALRTAWTGKE